LRPGCSYDLRRASLRTYLFGIIKNQSLKRIRGKDPGGQSDTDSTTNPSPEGEVLRSELEEVVARAVTRLPESQKEILILAHYEQVPLTEIARAMTLDLGAVKSRLQRARASLKATLATYLTGLERKR
jgi:RNA polymerase sigma-70 factor (ECF subfamily)